MSSIDYPFSFSLRSSWLKQLIFKWNLVIWSIMLWDSGFYLNLIFWQIFPATTLAGMKVSLPYYCQARIEPRFLYWPTLNPGTGVPHHCWAGRRVLIPHLASIDITPEEAWEIRHLFPLCCFVRDKLQTSLCIDTGGGWGGVEPG